MKKNIFLSVFCIFSFWATAQNTPLKTQYNSPAKVWESEAMPLGNGFIGTMVFGDVPIDVIQVNEHSLWSGGPGKNPAYDGGHKATTESAHGNLQTARNSLQNDMTGFSATKTAYIDGNGKVVAQNYPENGTTKAYINSLKGTKADFGSYQSLGNIHIGYPSVSSIPEIVNITGDCDNPNSSGERFPMLFDNSTSTKWYADTGWKGFPCYIAWEYDIPVSVSAYSLTSGNDMPGRDPKDWKLYGSTDGTNYILIDSRTGITFSQRNQTRKFTLAQPVTYQYYKYEISATFQTNNAPQLSEISFETVGTAQFPPHTNYHRELDIEKAVAKVTYTMEGVNYTREYFVSHPDNAIIIRLTADKPGMLSRTIWLTTPQTKIAISAENATITMTGQPADQKENGLKFAQQLRVITSNGTVTASGKKLVVENADEILIVSSAATNYQQCMDETFSYFSDTDPLAKVQETIDKIGRRTYADVLETHINDYRSLFSRMSLHFTGAANPNNKMTNILLSGYKKTNTAAENLYLEELYYQFGRYLLIASSRKNGLPANLQGIWAEGLAPPWAADYHTNINIQMNYWLAEQTNLADCHRPAVDYVKSLVPRGKYTAQRYFYRTDGKPMRGWVDFHENNIWGNTGPAESDAFYFPAAAGWLCQDIWEYYLFNQDKNFLEEYFPVMLDAALFWVDNLWTDTRDNTLVSSPSYSPEHGPYSLGASCDQAIITELFDMVIKADQILNPSKEADSPEIAEIREAKSRLAGPEIGLAGQFMEWKDETAMDISGDGGHRHVNHLFWLHPGSQIIPGRSAQENLYAEAMKKTLNTRGDGGTGWSKAWKINFWARLRDGNHSHKLLEELLKESTLANLFDTHPPFQIDGNFGATAGMTEMLVQSQGEAIELLPALPDSWLSGNVRGIKARGNFEISMDWDGGKIASLEITSNSGNNCIIRYPGISKKYSIILKGAGAITPAVLDENTIQFETIPAGVYEFIHSTGIKQFQKKDKTVEIYPNPIKAGEKITVMVNRDSPVNYYIVNTLGAVLKEGKLKTGENVLTLPAQKGVFILADNTGSKDSGAKIIIH
jgi:hypothetical protein